MPPIRSQTLPAGLPRQLHEAFEEAYADQDHAEAFRVLGALEACLHGSQSGMHPVFALDLLVDCHRRLLQLRQQETDEALPVAVRKECWSEVEFINRQTERAWHRMHGRPSNQQAA